MQESKSLIKLKPSPEQIALMNEIIKGNQEAIDTFKTFMKVVLEQIIKEAKIGEAECDWLPVNQVTFSIPVDVSVIIRRPDGR